MKIRKSSPLEVTLYLFYEYFRRIWNSQKINKHKQPKELNIWLGSYNQAARTLKISEK